MDDTNNQPAPEATEAKPADPVVPADVEKKVPEQTDTVTLATPAPVVEEPAAPVSDVQAEQVPDDENVTTLKIMLDAFNKAVMRPGKKPEDYKGAAKLAAQLTQHVIQFPKVPVLDALLAFFEENKDGAASPANFMKGSTTLGAVDERKVGFLFSLFRDLATKTVVRINNAMVVNVLKKQEIADYYNRRMAGIRHAAASTDE